MNLYAVLADPTRRAMLEQLAEGPLAATELAGRFPISQPAAAKHLRMLREADLVETSRVPEDARMRLYSLRSEPLREVEAWLQQFWQQKLDAFADYVEERP